jgi:hypothetical protein
VKVTTDSKGAEYLISGSRKIHLSPAQANAVKTLGYPSVKLTDEEINAFTSVEWGTF